MKFKPVVMAIEQNRLWVYGKDLYAYDVAKYREYMKKPLYGSHRYINWSHKAMMALRMR